MQPAENGVTIRAEGLSKVYQSGANRVSVFTDLAFEFEAGERVAVVGESGAGKSTLLHLLGALDRPSSGAVYYDSGDIFQLNEAALAEFRNRQIGYVWQMQSLLVEFTALENVMMPLLVRGCDFDSASRQASSGLEEVGLSARAGHRAGELSGGEQQRVALARALAGRPRVLLADEPTGNLDHRTGEAVAGLLAELHRVHQFTTVIVTHNLALAETCDRVLQLEKGSFSTRRTNSTPDPGPG